MEKLTMCRVCLSEEVQLQYIHNTHLEEVYESLTSKPFVIQDGRPLRACYICCAQLENCYRLQKTCLRSEELFTQLLSSNDLGPLRLAQELSNRLKIVAVVHLSTGGVLPESRGANIKKEPTDILDDAAVEGPDEMEDERRSRLFEDLNSWETEHTPLYRLNSGLNRVDINLETEQQSEHSEGLPDDDDCWTQEEDITLFVANNELQDADADEAVRPVLEDSVATAALENVPSSIPGNDIPHAFVKTEPQDVGANMKDQPQSSNGVFRSALLSEPENATALGIGKDELHEVDTCAPVCETPGPSRQREHTVDITSCKVVSEAVNAEFPEDNIAKLTTYCEHPNSGDKRNVTTSLKGNGPRVYTRAVKKTKTYPCNHCQEGFSTKSDLLKHAFLTHPCKQNEETNTSIIDLSFKNKGSTDSNKTNELSIDLSTVKRLLKCDICGKQFLTSVEVSNHMLSHTNKQIQCGFCYEFFDSQYKLNHHIKHVHSDEKKYKCDLCNELFFFLNTYIIHMRKHTGYEPFKCPECHKCFHTRAHLISHISQTHAKVTPYQCNVCKKDYKDKRQIVLHIMYAHTQDNIFECEMCDKRFSSKSFLDKHKLLHCTDRPYQVCQCNVCKKRFATLLKLNNHKRRVHTYRPFQCEVCNDSFRLKSSLRKHMLIHNCMFYM